ncbi:hypothetical protein GGF50DRAFT_116985 [Schizophyllum commune]
MRRKVALKLVDATRPSMPALFTRLYTPFSRSKTLRACLKRLVCLKIPWDRVNPTRFEGGGQLVFESGSERESDAIE